MGRYFNPPTPEAVIAQGGRKLDRFAKPNVFGQLQPGERLGWLLDRIAFRQIPDVTNPDEFAEFNAQVRARVIIPGDFYAIPADAPGWAAKVAYVEV